MNTVKITYYGMEGEGRTLTEARKNAGRKLEACVTGSHAPIIRTITHAGRTFTVFIFRELDRWGYQIIEHGKTKDGQSWASANEPTDKDAARAAFRHLAQWSFSFEDDGADLILSNDKEGMADHKHWALWQHKYQAWRSVGKSDYEAHNLAENWPEGFKPTYTE